MKTLAWLFVFLCSVGLASADTYYVDATNGDDYRDGKSEANAWKSLWKINISSFNPGDFVLFKRGEVWQGSGHLSFPSSGTLDDPITLGAYGEGADPTIKASYLISGFVLCGGVCESVWEVPLLTEPSQVFFDEERGVERQSCPCGLMADNEWCWNSGVLYIRSVGTPDRVEWTGTVSWEDVSIMIQRDHIVIEDLELAHGVFGIFTSEFNGLTIRNVTFRDLYYTSVEFFNDASNSDTLLIDGVTAYNNGGSGISVVSGSVGTYNTNNVIIQNSEAYNNCLLSDDGKHEWTAGIKVWGNNSAENLIIRNNYTHDNGISIGSDRGHGILIDEWGAGALVEHNLAENNIGSGVMVEHSSGVEVRHNRSFGNAQAGLELRRGSSNNKMEDNVAYGNNIGILVQGTISLLPDDTTQNLIKNNIIFNNIERALSAIRGGENDGVYGYGNVYTNNCLGPESPDFIEWGLGVHKSTYDDWETAYGSSTHSIKIVCPGTE